MSQPLPADLASPPAPASDQQLDPAAWARLTGLLRELEAACVATARVARSLRQLEEANPHAVALIRTLGAVAVQGQLLSAGLLGERLQLTQLEDPR